MNHYFLLQIGETLLRLQEVPQHTYRVLDVFWDAARATVKAPEDHEYLLYHRAAEALSDQLPPEINLCIIRCTPYLGVVSYEVVWDRATQVL